MRLSKYVGTALILGAAGTASAQTASDQPVQVPAQVSVATGTSSATSSSAPVSSAGAVSSMGLTSDAPLLIAPAGVRASGQTTGEVRSAAPAERANAAGKKNVKSIPSANAASPNGSVEPKAKGASTK